MADPTSSPRERIVLGFLLLGFSLVGLFAVSSSRLDVRGTFVRPDPLLARAALVAALLTLVVAAALSIGFFGLRAGLGLVLREGWPGLLAGAGGGAIVGFFLRAVFPGLMIWIVVALCYAAGVFFIFWFARRARPTV
jgi:hypothetical protein